MQEQERWTEILIIGYLTGFFSHCRVLVLDSGRIIEFETPQNLKHKRGLFFDMLTEAGITGDSGAKNKQLFMDYTT